MRMKMEWTAEMRMFWAQELVISDGRRRRRVCVSVSVSIGSCPPGVHAPMSVRDMKLCWDEPHKSANKSARWSE